MIIKKISLNNFRNYETIDFFFEPSGALIFGKNGLGKTNLLEALYILAFGKSFRVNTDIALINFTKAFFQIKAQIEINSLTYDLEFNVQRDGKKDILINGKRIARISELHHYLKLIYFSLDDINIINESPKLRRNFFDQAISQIYPGYLELLKKYYVVLLQRNSLLKTQKDLKTKPIWDKQLSTLIEEILIFRNNYLALFNQELIFYYEIISEGREKVLVKYKQTQGSVLQKTEEITEYFKQIEKQEFQNQRTLFGPHLDDYQFFLNGAGLKVYGSQGQKRSFIISSRFAQSKILRERIHLQPILIFDDVLSDLDSGRTKQIIRTISQNHQTFIATPHQELYGNLALDMVDLEKVFK